MKRDMDLVRSIMLKVEQEARPVDNSDSLAFPPYEHYVVVKHVEWLVGAGFLKAINLKHLNGDKYGAIELTWNGHEFIEAIKDDTIWAKTKKSINESGGAFATDLILGVAKAYLKQKLGLAA